MSRSTERSHTTTGWLRRFYAGTPNCASNRFVTSMWIAALWTAAQSLFLAEASFGSVETTFDADLEGWAVFGDNVFYWTDGAGNPGGCLQIDDDAIGEWGLATAPPAYLGDWSAFAPTDSLVYDAIHIPLGSQTGNPPVMFRIEGPGGAATATQAGFPAHVWNHFAIPIDPTAWEMQTGTWTGLISNVTAVELAAEMIVGDEVVLMDNVRLDGDPLPTSPTVILDTFEDGLLGWSGHSASVTLMTDDGDTGAFLKVVEDRDGGRAVLPSWYGGPWTEWEGIGEFSFSF